jgi:LysR family transcriptional regulator, glycine cleavage system transcriptional activator
VRRLPSLNAVVTFEAAARLGSFTLAARELRVTQGAVSRGIAGLEEWLGVPLFLREGKSVKLTEPGRAYRDEVSVALDRITVATARVTEAVVEAPLVLDVLPTLAMRWLIPRLPLFQSLRPGVEVRIVTNDREVSSRDTFDVAIRRGPRRRPGLRSVRFLEEEATPVCAPSLLRGQKLARVADLARHTLLSADTRSDAWPSWLAVHGAAGLKPRRVQRFDHYYVALQAAQDGLGVAMGALPIVEAELASGRLVAPFADRTVSAPAYYALTHVGMKRPVTHAFVLWLTSLDTPQTSVDSGQLR